MEREVYSKGKLLKTVEEQNKKDMDKMKADFKAKMGVFELKLQQEQFTVEDLASGAMRRELFVDELHKQIDLLNYKIKKLEEK